jgi:carbonic anhydrase/acetyltransferase-like protein (isoleucine patch superfamily)
MSLQLNDRVKETSTTTGTVPIVLNGASIGYQSISSAISPGNSFPYVIELTGGAQWEIGIGTYVSGNNSIIRTQVLSSSDSGNKVDFLSGSKNVFITVPAAYTALTARGLSQFSATSSAELASIISDETGSGKLVFSNNAILVTPDIGRANGTSLTLSGDLSVTGNVYLSGNVTTLSSNNLSIHDPLIYLAQENPANLQDIGIVGHFTSDHYQHTGLVRDATDGVWKFFSNVASEPTTTVDFTGVIYDTIQVGSINTSNAVFSTANGSAPFSVVSNTLVSNLNADLLDGQHGTYYTGLTSSAFNQANSAYTTANTGVSIGQEAFSQANAAYTQANTGTTIGLSALSQANSAYTAANVGIATGQAAFGQANVGITLAQTAFSQANAAYNQANVGIIIGQAAFGQANSAYNQANAAYAQANVGIAVGQAAFGQANVAYNQANTGVTIGQGAFGQANVAYNTANTGITVGQAAFSQANAAYNTANTKFSANGGTISGSVTITNDLNVSGNVYLSGNVTTVSSTNLIVNDPILYLANNNIGNTQDIGFVGHFTNSSYQHTGLVRKASDGIWRLFSNVSTEPTSTVDFTNGIYDTLQIGSLIASNANFSITGAAPFTVTSNTVVVNLNADLLDGQHGTYYTGLTGVAFDQANSAYNQANTGITVGQTAFTQANAAYNQANTGITIGQAGFDQANSGFNQANVGITISQTGFNQANAAYNQANTGITIGQAGFDQANSGFNQANAAYSQANTGIVTGQAAFGQANSAYNQANTGITIGQGAFGQANSGFNQANLAYTAANTGISIAQTAFSQANAAYAQANTGITIAQTAFGQANSGFNQANAAYAQANVGIAIAQSAYNQANSEPIGKSAFDQANAAYTAANTGITVGQAAYTQANAAYNTANTKFSANGGTISGSVTITTDLNVTGNVYLGGNVTTLSSNNLSINDPLIYLAQDNPANLQDIGLVGNFTSDRYQHTGLVRDASDNMWKLFSNVASEPTSTIDFTGGVIYDTLKIGSLITSNAAFNVASGTAPFTVNSVTLVNNLNADLLDGQQANYYTGLSNSANTQANMAIAIGQGAFTQANTAYNQANTGIAIAQTAFGQANLATTLAQTAFGQANTAYIQANTAITIGQEAFDQANSAYNTANTGVVIGQSAFTQANVAYTTANSATILAQTAFTQANVAYTAANSATTLAQTVFTQANSGIAIAQTAFGQANASYSQANTSLVVGQSAFAQANAAYNKANTGGSGITATAIKTANYTASVNELVRCNTAAGAFSVTLPASPADGSLISISDIGSTFAVNNLTLLPNGNNLESYSTPYVLDINGAYVSFIYNTATTNWKLLETPVTVMSAISTVTVAQGGTGANTFTANSILLGSGTSAIRTVSPGTEGNLLTSNNGTWISAPAPISLPTQTSNGGKYLTTDGATATWVNLPLGSVYDQTNSAITLAQTAFGQANAAYNTANTKFSANGGTITGSVTISTDLSVSGNVYLGGNVTTLSSNNLSISDPLIYMAQDNPANLQDIGIVGHFTSSRYQHTGLVRDATDGVWKLFSNVAAEPTTTVDFTGGVVYDTLQIGSVVASNAVFTVSTGTSPFTVASNTLISNLNADLLDGQHGSYYTDLSNTALSVANSAYNKANTGTLPSQSANTGKYLTTDGSVLSWGGILRNVPILNRLGNTVNVTFTFNYLPVLNHANTSTIQVGII